MIQPNSTPPAANRVFGLDLIKVIACFLVVALHTCVTKELFSLASVFYYSGVVAIPLFFMVHGYLLFGKTRTDKWYFYKKIGRIFLLVFVMNTLLCLCNYFSHQEVHYWLIAVSGNLFLQKGYFGIFWFFGALILIYQIFPFLDYLYQHKQKIFVSLAVFLIGCQMIVDALNIFWAIQYSDLFQKHIPQTFRLESHLSYFLLGGCMKMITHCGSTKIKLKYIILLYTVMMTYSVVMSKFVYPVEYCEYFYDNILVIGLVITLFLYLLQREKLCITLQTAANFLSPLIMLIYVLHMPVKSLVGGFCFGIGVLELFAVFGVSVLVSYAINKIPIVRALFKI